MLQSYHYVKTGETEIIRTVENLSYAPVLLLFFARQILKNIYLFLTSSMKVASSMSFLLSPPQSCVARVIFTWKLELQ